MAHKACLARWQLQSAGTRKETNCEFCDSTLPDWKGALAPSPCSKNVPAIMNVNFDGKTYSFEVEPGPDGYTKFTEAIRRAFELPEDSELNITFTCDEPTLPEVGSLLTLQGPGAYDAAVHCAALSAARRIGSQAPSTPLRTSSLPVDFERTRYSPEGEEPSSEVMDSQDDLQSGMAPHIPRYTSLPGPHEEVMEQARDRPAEADIGSVATKTRLSGRISRRIHSLLEAVRR
jgi:hypothetical protein